MSRIRDARKRLAEQEGDSEGYHSEFDDIIEERLMELDPEFMTELQQLYKDSGCARWCA